MRKKTKESKKKTGKEFKKKKMPSGPKMNLAVKGGAAHIERRETKEGMRRKKGKKQKRKQREIKTERKGKEEKKTF